MESRKPEAASSHEQNVKYINERMNIIQSNSERFRDVRESHTNSELKGYEQQAKTNWWMALGLILTFIAGGVGYHVVYNME